MDLAATIHPTEPKPGKELDWLYPITETGVIQTAAAGRSGLAMDHPSLLSNGGWSIRQSTKTV